MIGKAKYKKDVIGRIAKKFNTSPEEVKNEIQILINAARNNPDPETQAYFTKLFGNKTPTPEEFIDLVTLELIKETNI